MDSTIQDYHSRLSANDKSICDRLYEVINASLPSAENKIWHAHPVCFLEGNPIVGYSKLKDSVRLLKRWLKKAENISVGLQKHCQKERAVREIEIKHQIQSLILKLTWRLKFQNLPSRKPTNETVLLLPFKAGRWSFVRLAIILLPNV